MKIKINKEMFRLRYYFLIKVNGSVSTDVIMKRATNIIAWLIDRYTITNVTSICCFIGDNYDDFKLNKKSLIIDISKELQKN